MTRIRYSCPVLLAASLVALSSAHAQESVPVDKDVLTPAAGVEVWASTDADDTEVLKVLARALWKFEGNDSYQGIAVEKAWFRPLGQKARKDERVYLEIADGLGDHWLGRARIGTDSHTVLGSISIRKQDWSQNYFIEREMVETPLGVDEGIYYTFAGANFDLPVDERNIFTTMVGVQAFTGDNERFHLRGSYIHVLAPAWGVSGQPRGRYYHSTTPNEFDYFSPRDYVELLPVVQVRRFDRQGWMYQVAAGYGAQYATGSDWQEARLGEIRVESPASSREVSAFAELQYTNTSITGGLDYDYVMGRTGLTVAF